MLTAGLWQLKKEKDKAEVLIALLPLAVYLPAVLGLLVLSFKINIMQARYFLVFTPLAFLFCAALINKAFKSGFAAYILWFIFLLLCAQSSLKFTAKFYNNPFPPKHFAQYYMDNYNGKTVLLATLYPYSQKLLPDIYDFYFKNYFKQDVKIYNLLADEAKYKGFIKDKDTIVYVPDCFVKTEDALLKFNLNKVHQDYTFNYCVFTGK